MHRSIRFFAIALVAFIGFWVLRGLITPTALAATGLPAQPVRWEYAVLGRVPLDTNLSFSSPEGTVTSDSLDGLSAKLGGPNQGLTWTALATVIGSKGWELVAVAPDSVANGSFKTCYFKRPRN